MVKKSKLLFTISSINNKGTVYIPNSEKFSLQFHCMYFRKKTIEYAVVKLMSSVLISAVLQNKFNTVFLMTEFKFLLRKSTNKYHSN